MHKTLAAAALTAMALATSMASAKGHGNGHNKDDGRRGDASMQEWRHDGRGSDRYADDDGRRGKHHGPKGRGHAYGHGMYGAGGYDHGPYFVRGGRLPGEYRSRQYVVDNWRGHRLSAPPRGTHWVQVGADYALVAIPTGVIVQVLINR